MKSVLTFALVAGLLASACSSSSPEKDNIIDTVEGMASWYGEKFHGRQTASGEIFNMNKMTAAHRTAPFGTKARITNLANGRNVIVTINDRGPFAKDRVLDCSRACAEELGYLARGVTRVRVDFLSKTPAKNPGKKNRGKETDSEGRVADDPPRAGAGDKFTVQAGAFKNIDAAEDLATRLEMRFFDVKVIEHKTGGGIIYRVRVGSFDTKDRAEFTRQKMQDHGFDAVVFGE